MNHKTETQLQQEELEALILAVQDEWQCGGLGHDTMYGKFAIEVAKRAVAAERARRGRGEYICITCGLRQDGYDAAGHAAAYPGF